MKYRRSRTLQSARYLKKKRNRNIVIGLLSILCVVSTITFFILFFRLPFLQISIIEVSIISGDGNLDTKMIEQKTLSDLDGYYLKYIPKSSWFFFPKNQIRRDLLDSFKKIDTIKVKRESLSTIEILITERVPMAVVCEDFKEDEDNNKCFFADLYGYVFEKVPRENQEKYFKYYMNSASSTIPIGTYFIDSTKFRELQKFSQTINDSGITTLGILVGEDGIYELYVKNKDDSLAIIYFDDRTSFEKTSLNLIVFWQNAIDKKIGTSTIPIFDYINLRFGNNIFYVTR